MAGLTVSGIGSGLDIDGIINSLMGVEQLPLQRLQQKSADYLTKISAFGQLRSALEGFQSAINQLASFDSLNSLSATSSNESILTVAASNEANLGSYSIKVDSLAQAQKLGSRAQPDTDTSLIGNAGDKLTITIGADSFSIDIGGKTLSQIQNAINDAADNIGVTAGIVRQDSGNFFLVLTAENTGTANSMSLTFSDAGGGAIADPLGFAELQAAVDAQITIDNTYTLVRDSNTITDAIQGLTIDLVAAGVDPVTVNISRNPGQINQAVSDFVSSYNTLTASLQSLGKGDLSGDSSLRLIESQVRSILGSAAGNGGAYAYAFQLGISFDKEGVLSLDGAKLSDALANNRDAVAAFFADEGQGMATRLASMLDGALGANGLIDSKVDGLNASIDEANNQMESMQVRLQQVEARFRAQFASLDLLLGQMQSTSNYLTTQLANLENLLPNRQNR